MVYIETKKLQTKKEDVISLSKEIAEILRHSGIRNGILTVEAPHSTVSLMATTDHGYRVCEDVRDELKRLVPSRVDFKHEESPDDAAGHIKSGLVGTSVTMIVKEGRLLAENKRGILLLEYDGPRQRTIHVCVIGE